MKGKPGRGPVSQRAKSGQIYRRHSSWPLRTEADRQVREVLAERCLLRLWLSLWLSLSLSLSRLFVAVEMILTAEVNKKGQFDRLQGAAGPARAKEALALVQQAKVGTVFITFSSRFHHVLPHVLLVRSFSRPRWEDFSSVLALFSSILALV